MKKRKTTLLAISILIAAVTFAVASRFAYKHRLERNLALVHQGLLEVEVISLLGHPHRVAHPCWGANPGCSFDYVYSMPFTSVGYDVISFDNSGRVIGKEEWYSP